MNTNALLKQTRGDLSGLIADGQVCLATFLQKKLPSPYRPDDKTWWNNRVIPHLTPNQKKVITEESIDKLDLAGLLNVLIGNWKKISRTREGFPLAHQMLEIRQTLAHSTTEDLKELSVEDIYRHLDTLERFLKVIEGNKELIQRVRSSKFNMVPLLLDQKLPRDPLPAEVKQGFGETLAISEFRSAPAAKPIQSTSVAPKTDVSQDVAAPNTVQHAPVIGGHGRIVHLTPDDTQVYVNRGLPKLSDEQYEAASKSL